MLLLDFSVGMTTTLTRKLSNFKSQIRKIKNLFIGLKLLWNIKKGNNSLIFLNYLQTSKFLKLALLKPLEIIKLIWIKLCLCLNLLIPSIVPLIRWNNFINKILIILEVIYSSKQKKLLDQIKAEKCTEINLKFINLM